MAAHIPDAEPVRDPGGPDLLRDVPLLDGFREIADMDRYGAVPSDWTVGIADVVQSTDAIARGDYKSVNLAGAAVISAVSNALGSLSFPFVFGGDGASFVVPPRAAEAATRALAATATFAAEELGLTLRTGSLPVSAIRAAGLDLRLARVAMSDDLTQTLVTGGGLAWAEARMKEGAFTLAAAPPGSRPDLTGLSCRFEPIRSRRGVILSIIVRATGSADGRYGALVADLLDRVENSPDRARPVPPGGPPLRWSSAGLALEARMTGRPWPLDALRAVTGFLILRAGLRIGGFDSARYLRQLVANSDYRKYDDGLRMTIDCSTELAAEIEALLATAERDGVAEYGVHRQDSALLTCVTPDATRSDHVHFVDGASGGYAAAAASLKRSTVEG